MKPKQTFSLAYIGLLMLIACLPGYAQSKVVLPGTFQSELGCSNSWGGDWDPDCNATALSFNTSSGMWEGSFEIPAGCWFYKIAYNGSWAENYGLYGFRDGANIPLYVPVTGIVNFMYNPVTHLITSSPYTSGEPCPPSTVVIPGSFQSELGCVADQVPVGGDWEPGCNYTRLTYNATSGLWEGTFDIPAGNWEYKVAINNSWGENYGLYGIPNGSNIPLNLCTPARITFKYKHSTHLVELIAESSAICIQKFYDANVNGYRDYNEPALSDVKFTLSGTGSDVKYTDASGMITFSNLQPGSYTVTESVPPGYYGTTSTEKNIELNLPTTMEFGNVCLGAGGSKSMGYWMGKNGQQTINNLGVEYQLMELRYLSLRNTDGSDFDPWTYAEVREWMKNAQAINMAYMLSAQLAALYLNQAAGFVKWDAIVYTPKIGNLGEGNFSTVWDLIMMANYSLYTNGYTPARQAERAYQEALKKVLDESNNNFNFVQSAPCYMQAAPTMRSAEKMIVQESRNIVWPNPSAGVFNLRITDIIDSKVEINVTDITGRRVLSFKGTTNRDLQFGEKLNPGIYFVEIWRDGQKNIERIIKQ
jgi:hypothetical protein